MDMSKIDKNHMPRHIGVIMDGNGRWAKQRGLKRFEGHREGAKVFRKISEYAADIGIEYMTFYAFSTENWKRPPEEVAAIMDLFREYLDEAEESPEASKGMKLRFIGERDALPQDIRNLMEMAESSTEIGKRTVINLAINYGGRLEIVEGVKDIAEKIKRGELDPKDITEQMISDSLYTSGQPDPDLIIRPSGEYRLSNFLIWQAAYSEFWFSNVLWPDFTTDDLDKAIMAFADRNRRFGGV